MNTITNLPLENSQFTSTWAFLFLTDGPRTQEVHSHLKSNEWVMEVTGHWAAPCPGRGQVSVIVTIQERSICICCCCSAIAIVPFIGPLPPVLLLLGRGSRSQTNNHQHNTGHWTLDTGHPTIDVSCYLKANRYWVKSILLSLFSYWVEYIQII